MLSVAAQEMVLSRFPETLADNETIQLARLLQTAFDSEHEGQQVVALEVVS
jgi:hypothetical protein